MTMQELLKAKQDLEVSRDLYWHELNNPSIKQWASYCRDLMRGHYRVIKALEEIEYQLNLHGHKETDHG